MLLSHVQWTIRSDTEISNVFGVNAFIGLFKWDLLKQLQKDI